MPDGYTTRGRASGACGHVHPDEPSAQACLDAYRAACAAEGTRSDRRVLPWHRPGPKATAGTVRAEQVLVRLAPDEAARLDAARGDLGRAEWLRQQIPRLTDPDPGTPS